MLVEYSKQGRSRTSRSQISWILSASTCCPHPEQISFSPAFSGLFSPHPQLQFLPRLINLFLIHLIARPSEDSRPVPLLHALRLTHASSKRAPQPMPVGFLRRALF